MRSGSQLLKADRLVPVQDMERSIQTLQYPDSGFYRWQITLLYYLEQTGLKPECPVIGKNPGLFLTEDICQK